MAAQPASRAMTEIGARRARVPWKAVGLIAGISAPVALVGNLLLYVLANAAGWLDPVTRGDVRPITEVEVIVATLVAVAAAVGAYVALVRLTRHPARNFTFVAAAVLAVSFLAPSTLAGAPGELIAALIAMHALTAGMCIGTVWLARHHARKGGRTAARGTAPSPSRERAANNA